MLKWVSANRALLIAYVIGLAAVGTSNIIMATKLFGGYATNLWGFAIALVAGLVDRPLHLLGIQTYPGGGETIEIGFSVAVLALLFPAVVWLLRRGFVVSKSESTESDPLAFAVTILTRVFGIALCILLLVMTFWWFPFQL